MGIRGAGMTYMMCDVVSVGCDCSTVLVATCCCIHLLHLFSCSMIKHQLLDLLFSSHSETEKSVYSSAPA